MGLKGKASLIPPPIIIIQKQTALLAQHQCSLCILICMHYYCVLYYHSCFTSSIIQNTNVCELKEQHKIRSVYYHALIKAG